MLLAGCGVYDGSEIQEAVSVLISLSKHKFTYDCYSLDKKQFDVVNVNTGETMNES